VIRFGRVILIISYLIKKEVLRLINEEDMEIKIIKLMRLKD
jgi:hypothetical protein